MTDNNTHFQELLDYIRSSDEIDLRIIGEAVNHRLAALKKAKVAENLRMLRVDDRVELVNVKPKYLLGTQGTIIERRGTKFKVQLDEHADRRAFQRFGGTPICPANILRKID